MVLREVADVVTNLDQEDEQSEDAAELIAQVFDQIGTFISDGALDVTDEVSMGELFH